MFELTKILRDPGQVDFGGAIGEAMEGTELSAGSEGANDSPAGDEAKGGEAGKAGGTESGKEEKKVVDGGKNEEAAEDPEFEMDYEAEEGKGKVKRKLSELKAVDKWLKDNHQPLRQYSKLTSEMNKNPVFKKIMDSITTGAFKEDGTLNEEFITQTASKLEANIEKVETKVDDIDEEIAAMEEQLADLDADSPQGKIAAKNIGLLKKTKQRLLATQTQLESFQKRVEGLENKTKTKEDGEAQARYENAVNEARQTFNEEVEALTKQESFMFEDGTDEKEEFDRLVRSFIGEASKQKKITSKESYITAIRESAKAAYKKITARREAIQQAWLKKNKRAGTGSGVKEETTAKAEAPGNIDEGLAGLISSVTDEVIKV